MSQPELLTRLVEFCDKFSIEYMLTGSMVSSIQSEPRMSHDIDVIVSVTESILKILPEAFPEPKYYCDAEAVRDAVRHESMFNLIDTDTGDKVDFWMLTDAPFDTSRFSRRIKMEMFGYAVWVSTPEDTILAKLRWSKKYGVSEKQLTDAFLVYENNLDNLHKDYLNHWVYLLGLKTEWQRIVSFKA